VGQRKKSESAMESNPQTAQCLPHLSWLRQPHIVNIPHNYDP